MVKVKKMLLCDDEAEAEAKSFTHKHQRIERGEGRRDKLPHVQVGFRVSDQVYRLCILTDSAVCLAAKPALRKNCTRDAFPQRSFRARASSIHILHYLASKKHIALRLSLTLLLRGIQVQFFSYYPITGVVVITYSRIYASQSFPNFATISR